MALEISKMTRTRAEQYELARQVRESARSIPANIAEGWAKRQSSAEFRRQVWLDFVFDEGYV